MKYLITGNAGFIGFHVAKKALEAGIEVIGIDVVNSYYDPQLKESRLALLEEVSKRTGTKYTFHRIDLTDYRELEKAVEDSSPDKMIHLAAQAGVRHSIEHPHDYVNSNLIAFTNVLEVARHKKIAHLVYASTSSVYGGNKDMPFSESHGVDHPLQFYAATKRANELMAHSYSNLFNLPTTGLRFFTAYGPWGRPDMALFIFTKNILEGKPIKLYNNGNHVRDFTYVEDIADGVLKLVKKTPEPVEDGLLNPGTSFAPFRIYNIGNNTPVKLLDYVSAIEEFLGMEAKKEFLPLQPGDVPDAIASNDALFTEIGYRPETTVREGVKKFINWYLLHYSN